MFGAGAGEAIALGLLAILLFGKRLPDVARKFGRHYGELRRSLNDIQSEFMKASRAADQSAREVTRLITYEDDDYVNPTAARFDRPPIEVGEPPEQST